MATGKQLKKERAYARLGEFTPSSSLFSSRQPPPGRTTNPISLADKRCLPRQMALTRSRTVCSGKNYGVRWRVER